MKTFLLSLDLQYFSDNPIDDIAEENKKLKAELDEIKQKEKAVETLKLAAEEAKKKADQLIQQDIKESELYRETVEKLFDAKMKEYRSDKKIVFPIGQQRAGNLSKADKQLLDIVMKRKKMEDFQTKAIFTTDGAGTGLNSAGWNPIELATEIQVAKEKIVNFRNGLRVIQMPSNPYRIPLRLGPALTTVATEAAAITENTTEFMADTVLTAVKIGANVPISMEEQEDAIVAILPEIRAAIAEGLANAEEELFANGTVNGTAVSGQTGFIADAGVSSTSDLTTTGWDTAVANVLKQMGQYGVMPSELRLFVGLDTYFGILYKHPDLMTLEKFGTQAIILTGEVARYKGIPVFVSQGIPVITGTPNTQVALIINTRAGVIGDRRMVTMKTWDNVQTDVSYIVGTERVTKETLFPAGVGKITVSLA